MTPQAASTVSDVTMSASGGGGGGGKPLVKTFATEGTFHQDFLIKEMMWMSADFENERKRHRLAAKKRGRQMGNHFKTLESKEAKARLFFFL